MKPSPAGNSNSLSGTRICHINFARSYRGGERQTELLVRALDNRGYSQTLICRPESPLIDKLQVCQGLTIRVIRRPYLAHLGVLRGAGLLHAHENRAGKFAYFASRILGIPYILTRRVLRAPSGRWPSEAVYRRAMAVACVSQAVAQILQRRFPGLVADVVHDAHADLTVNKARSEQIRAQAAENFLVAQVAALQDHEKGQRTTIAAARLLAEQGVPVKIMFIGDGPDAEILKGEAADLDNVIFVGFIENLGDYLAALDAIIMPSNHEGLGSSLLDAMYFGVPAVASNVGGIPEIVKQDHNGLLVSPRDAVGLANAITRLATDASLHARLSEGARKIAAKHGPERMADTYLNRIYARA